MAVRPNGLPCSPVVLAAGASLAVHLMAGWLLWRATLPVGLPTRPSTTVVELFDVQDLPALPRAVAFPPTAEPLPVTPAARTAVADGPSIRVDRSTDEAEAPAQSLDAPAAPPVAHATPPLPPGAAASTVDPSPVRTGVVVPDTPSLNALPEVLVAPDLRYPPQAYTDGRSGGVDLRVFLAQDGLVLGVQVLRSTPPGLFDTSAVQAFYEARFAPLAESTDPAAPRPVVVHVDVHVDYQVPPAGEAAGAPMGS